MKNKKTLLSKIEWGWASWVVPFLVCAFTILAVTNLISNEVLASSIEPPLMDNRSPLKLQVTDPSTSTLQIETPSLEPLQSTDVSSTSVQFGSASNYSFSLVDLGYEDTILISPADRVVYSFRLPENWIIQSSGLLELDISYLYSQIEGDTYPAFFGDLTVLLNDKSLSVFPLEEAQLDHFRLQVPIPPSLLNDPGQLQTIELVLNAGLLCDILHKATLTIHPTTFISFNYNQAPIVADLARYPWPFFQRAFEPDQVRFVLPSKPTTADLNNTLPIAAKLGNLTGDRLVISGTTDLELGELLASSASLDFDEHLIIVGQPQNNQLLPILNDIADMPVSLHQRQLELVTEGPAVIAPGDTLTYVFTVTNTIDESVDLSLVNSLPLYTELMDCSDCVENTNNGVAWRNNLLEPGETRQFFLTLKAGDIPDEVVTLENTITLVEADLGPVNANTLVSSVVLYSTESESQTVLADKNGYFYVYNDQAVPASDGIVQEILVPWNEEKAILVITGLSDEAVQKASQAMSSETRFPGMSGQVALIRDALTPSEIDDITLAAIEMTFEEMGYSDQVLRVESGAFDYFFEIPYGWQLVDGAAIDLHFSHSQLIDYEKSGLTALINQQPAATIALSEKTAGDGYLHIDLADTGVRSGRNRLSVQIEAPPLGECVDGGGLTWTILKNSSKISLVHTEDTDIYLDLESYPYPFFYLNPALTDLLFALPEAPIVGEWEAALRIAANLGNSSNGKTILPRVVTGNDIPIEGWKNYNIIALGRPSRHTLLQEINDRLPQPFLAGTDEIVQQLDDVVLRLPSDIDLGYIQLLPSPWNRERAFMAVIGVSDQGTKWAADTLANGAWALEGNLAVINLTLPAGDQVTTINTLELTSDGVAIVAATAVAEMADTSSVTNTTAVTATSVASIAGTPTPLPLPTPIAAQTLEAPEEGSSRPAWLIPLIGVNGLIVVSIFALALWRGRRQTLKRNS